MSTTRTPTRPPAHERPTVPTRVTGPGPAPRSSRFWLLVAIAAAVVTALVIAAVLWMAPGADTGAELSQADFATTARLEEQARQERADFATTARLEEQARQERADFATTARLEEQASAYEQARQARSNAAYTARLDGLAESELAR